MSHYIICIVDVNIKGRSDGITVEVGRGAWHEIMRALADRLEQSASFFRNGVVALDRLRGPTVVGYMFGGIYSTVSNTSGNTFRATGASNQVFQITLTPT